LFHERAAHRAQRAAHRAQRAAQRSARDNHPARTGGHSEVVSARHAPSDGAGADDTINLQSINDPTTPDDTINAIVARYPQALTTLPPKTDKAKAGQFAVAFAATLAIAPERRYGTWQEMAEQEAGRADGIEVVAIMTPNDSHYAIARTFLERGVHVICDKPLTNDLVQALELQRLAEDRGLVFGVTFNYSGYPMVRQARAMVRGGELVRVEGGHHNDLWSEHLGAITAALRAPERQ